MPCGRRFSPAMGSPVAILILNERMYAIPKCSFHSGTFPSFVYYFGSQSQNNIHRTYTNCGFHTLYISFFAWPGKNDIQEGVKYHAATGRAAFERRLRM